MSVDATTARPLVLADLVRPALVSDALLVGAAAAGVGIAAQISIPLPGTPVPLTLQTFAVLLAAAALGWRRAALSLGLYILVGMAGVPWFAGAKSGWGGASFGYVIGFLVAAALVGFLASRNGDRTPLRTAGTMLLGTLVIYAVGVPWLMASVGIDLPTALSLGVAPFLIGDVVKVAAASAVLPGVWALVQRRNQ